LERHAQVARDTGGERCFAQARRAVQQNVAQRFFAFPRGVDRDGQPLRDLPLADHLVHVPRTQRDLVVAEFAERMMGGGELRRGSRFDTFAGEDSFTGHA
jgi:hypothetical protein